jgi:arabinan endo-1,5-alpha-L-arabinosidase
MNHRRYAGMPRFWAVAGRPLTLALTLALAALASPAATPSTVDAASANYRNPLNVTIPDGGSVDSCADPTVIRGQTAGDNYWYMYCTTDPLNGDDRSAGGDFNFRLIPMLRSSDLVTWTYMGDAFSARPEWVADDAGMWAPEIQYFNGQYYLYYTASWTDLPGGGSAIGVATAPTALGPWTDAGAPAVEPHAPDCCPGDKRWTFDPDVIEHDGVRYIYYGSYFGGISVRQLSADGLTSDPATQTNVAMPNRYEGAEVVKRGDYFYLLASATDCCRGPLTGYSVFVGRSASPTGPFIDREGVSLLAGRVGGSVFLSMNGNRWVGPGHQTTFKDFDGQWWTAYHAVDQEDPYFEGAVGFTRRPVLLDPVDWINGWPEVRGGAWASDKPMKRPAAQPGQKSRYRTDRPTTHTARKLVDGDEFNGTSLGGGWSWVREPGSGTSVSNGSLRWDTQPADLYEGSNNASVLTRALPEGNWIAETRLRLNLPAEGCCYNYVQAGMVVYGGDDNYLKLVQVSIWDTRQTEWAKELFPVEPGYPRYGNTVVTAPGEWTYLRIARWERGDTVHYQAYTSRDGTNWNRGGVWNHDLDAPAIGLVSMGGSGFTAEFDYLRIHKLQAAGGAP